jgi:hypothetical protein
MHWLRISTGLALALASTASCGDDDSTADSTTASTTPTGDEGGDGSGDDAPTTAGSGSAGGTSTTAPGSSSADDGGSGGTIDDCHTACPDDPDGHVCCQDMLGPTFFCNDDDTCTMASGCEAESCCVPGPDGDAYCRGIFGDGSECSVLGGDGVCAMASAG